MSPHHLVIWCRNIFYCLVFFGLFAHGQTAVGWRELRTRLQAEIDDRVQSELLEVVRPEALALAHGLSWPVVAPAMTLDQVYAEFEKGLQEELSREFPDSQVEEILQEALRRHGYWQIGDEVTLQTRGKMSHKITGRLQAVTPARVKIANRWLSAVDLDDEVMARFFPEQAEQAQKKYVERETRRLHLRRQTFVEQYRQQHLPVLLRQNGYQPIFEGSGPENLNPANWLAQTDILAQWLYTARQEKAVELQLEVEREVFAEQGFFYDPATKQWLPETERKALRGKRGATRRSDDDGESSWSKLKKLFR